VPPPTLGPTTPTTARVQRYAYPAGGPTDPVFPPGLPTYSLVASRKQCQQLLAQTQIWDTTPSPYEGVIDVTGVEGADTKPLYMSAAYACLGSWKDAVRVYGQIKVATPDFHHDTCVRMELLHWLTPLIDAARRDPNFSPVFVPSSARSPCPTDTTTP
jgi:hypothetical protein